MYENVHKSLKRVEIYRGKTKTWNHRFVKFEERMGYRIVFVGI